MNNSDPIIPEEFESPDKSLPAFVNTFAAFLSSGFSDFNPEIQTIVFTEAMEIAARHLNNAIGEFSERITKLSKELE